MRTSQKSLLVALAGAALVLEANAQSAASTSIVLGGGFTSLTSNSRELRRPGAHAQVGVERGVRSYLSDRVRLELSYHSIEGVASPFLGTPRSSMWIAAISAIREIGSVKRFRPYVIGGVGGISLDQGGGREWHANVAGGVGVLSPRVGRARVFVEGRFSRALTGEPNSFIPWTLGVLF